MKKSTIGQKFNDDLLVGEEDQALATRSFPDIVHVLDFPELRELFSVYDMQSNLARKRRRIVGLIAITLGVIALLGASSKTLYANIDPDLLSKLGYTLAALGVFSILAGGVSVLSNNSKKRWLCGRLMAERLRQFQFQIFVCRLPTILRSTHDLSTRIGFIEARRGWLAAFQMNYVGHLDGKLKDVLDDLDDDLWLHELESAELASMNTMPLDQVFASYRILRIQHQIQYANYKLRDGDIGSPAYQAILLGQAIFICILIVFAIHLMIAVSMVGMVFVFANSELAHVLVVWASIVVLAMRSLEEGLQPGRETERYKGYKSQLNRLLYRFDQASALAEKLEVMRETEQLVYYEMKEFLKINSESRFLL